MAAKTETPKATEVTLAEADGWPTSGGPGRPRNFAPEATALAEAVLAGKVVKVTGADSEKILRQARTLVVEAGQKLKTRTIGEEVYAGLAPVKS